MAVCPARRSRRSPSREHGAGAYRLAARRDAAAGGNARHPGEPRGEGNEAVVSPMARTAVEIDCCTACCGFLPARVGILPAVVQLASTVSPAAASTPDEAAQQTGDSTPADATNFATPATSPEGTRALPLNRSVERAVDLQNPDGSFSTDWFLGRANRPDADRKVLTTGHILEWLAYELPAERLRKPDVTRAVNFLLSQIWDQRDRNWAIGPRSHARRALVLHDQKLYQSKPGERRMLLSGHTTPSALQR